MTDLDTKLAERGTRQSVPKAKKSRSNRTIGLPAPVVFWIMAPIGAAGAVMPVIRDVEWVILSGAAIVLLITILLINDRKGFIRSREMRRAYEARRHFSIIETIVLFLLVMVDMLAGVYALLMAAAP